MYVTVNTYKENKKKINNDELISVADFETAKRQWLSLLRKGYGSTKWILKYFVGCGALRMFDYGRTFAQFYAEFTKRLDTLGIYISTIMQEGYQFVLSLQTVDDPRAVVVSREVVLWLKSFNEFMTQNILPLANKADNEPRKVWYKMEAVCMITRDLKLKGVKVKSMESPEFKLKFYEFETRHTKLPSVDTMAQDLLDLDGRLNKKGGRYRGGYYGHEQQQYQRHLEDNLYQDNGYSGWGNPTRREMFSRNDNPTYNDQYRGRRPTYPYRGKRRRGRGGGRRGRGRDYDRDYDRDRRRRRSRSRSRSRDRKERDKVRPDFPDETESNWEKKKGQYVKKDGQYYGNAKLEADVCGYFKDTMKRCTYGSKKCKWHHMCTNCHIIGRHNANECTNRRDMRM